MPDLPTVPVTQEQADRMIAAFSGQTNDQNVEITPLQAYKRWYRKAVVDEVLRLEASKIEQEYKNKDVKLESLRTRLS